MSRESIHAIRRVYQAIHSHRLNTRMIEDIQKNVPDTAEVREFIDFVRSAKRGIVPSVGGRRAVFEVAEE
jgi:acyl-[acyl carrier protein]--UDP-N-acetylglucosamine O-acyltransferase